MPGDKAQTMELEKQFLTLFIDDLNANRVVLPSLPEVAQRVRTTIENPDVDVSQVAKVVTADPALSARLLKVANSPVSRPNSPITSVQTAISRLGLKQVRNIVTSLVLEQLYQIKATQPIRKQLQELWSHSTKVAALSHVLARRYTKLAPDEAMLAGLVHDIGVLPILMRVDTVPELAEDPVALQRVIKRLHCVVGTSVLEDWHFPENFVIVAIEHENIHGKREGAVDLSDVVILANLHSHIGTNHPHAKIDWATIPAFAKLGLTPDESLKTMQEAQQELQELRNLMSA